MANCGDAAIGQFWLHKNAIWNKVGGGGTNANGIDGGASFNAATPDGVTAGSYLFGADWGSPGVDGCAFLTSEADGTCGSSPDPLPVDVVIAGRSPSNPTQSIAFFGSVDFNPAGQSWILDNLGAPVVDGHCADVVQAGPVFNCAPVPSPAISSFAPGAPGHIVYQVNLPAQSVTYADDCNVAESAAVNCPRNLNAGRVLMVRRGPCFGGTPVNNNAVIYNEQGSLSTRTELWHAFNAGDANYDGIVDATLVANPLTTVAAANTTQPVDITLLASATPGVDDCLYLGAAAAGDATPNAGFTPFLAPYVSMERHSAIPICQFVCPNGSCATAAGQPCPQGGTSASNTGATPAPDKVLGLVASKTGSNKFSVAWSTSGEESISKLTLVGNRTNGTVDIRNVQLKGGGLGANYSVDLTSGDLKGSKKVSVIVTYNDGSKASFGPVAVE
jgi:hypothetical protein